MRAGKVLGPDWHGFHIWRGVLCTPEGHRFEPSDLVWQSLLVQQARAFREFMRDRIGSKSAQGNSGLEVPQGKPVRARPGPPGVPATTPAATMRSGGCGGQDVDRATVPGASSNLSGVNSTAGRIQNPSMALKLPTSNRGVSETERSGTDEAGQGFAPSGKPRTARGSARRPQTPARTRLSAGVGA
jgi:hypothetical protein